MIESLSWHANCTLEFQICRKKFISEESLWSSETRGKARFNAVMSSVVLAKALYSNDSEADDELSFKKGDVITVLETDFDGMVGWWLCSLGDRQGVAPGNRLQLISFDDNVEDTGNGQDIYDTPVQAHKKTYGDVDYDVPKSYPTTEYEDYAIPKTTYGNYPLPESQRHGFVLPSPLAFTAGTERHSNSSDGLVTNEIYAAPSSRWSSERSSDEFRFSGEIGQESGSEEMYDVPSRNSINSEDGQRNLGLHVPLVPPKARIVSNGYQSDGSSRFGYFSNNTSRQGSLEIYDSPAGIVQDVADAHARYANSSEDLYDQLPNNDGKHANTFDDDYAIVPLPQSTAAGREDIYDVPPAGPEELYDEIPSGPREIYDVLPTGSEELYDVPPSSEYSELPVYKKDATSDFADGNNNPPVEFPNKSRDDVVDASDERNFPEAVYDNFADLRQDVKAVSGTGSLGRKKRHDSDDYVDYQEIYGLGDKQTTQVSGKQSNEQSVFERIHMDKVRELRLSHMMAMQNLDKLQQAVDVAVTKLMSFVTEDWRRSEVYALNINGIREISGKVKVALRLLTEFGLGALKNSQKLADKEISRKIEDALKPLLESYYSIKTAIQELDESNWRSAYQEKPDDELNTIARLAQGIPCDAYNLGAVVANVSCVLFKSPPENDADQASPSETTETRNVCQSSHCSASSVPMPSVSSKMLESGSPAQDALNVSSAMPVQMESAKKPAASKSESHPIANQPQVLIQAAKTPPPVSPKPKKERESNDSSPNYTSSLSGTVSELTNNLLNQLDNMTTSKSSFRRTGSKKLSPRTVRRLCSITLKTNDKIDEKITENAVAAPAKPSRQCSSPADYDDSNETSVQVEKRSSLVGTMSDPGLVRLLGGENCDENDNQTLSSFVEKMDSQLIVLKEGIKNFGESVRERQKPKVFVAHSKFIVLSAHKLVYLGDGASRSVTNVKLRDTISSATNCLSEVVNDFVESIKTAARQFPEERAMNCMIKSATSVTEKALGLYKALKRPKQY